MKNKVKLIIDPGHGGLDNGATAVDGSKEKGWNLEISEYQYRRFLELGLKDDEILMTRTKDEYVSLTERTNFIKKHNPILCISNHNNASNGKAYGAETIHSIHNDGKLGLSILNGFKYDCKQKIRRNFSKKNDSGKDWYHMNRNSGNVTVYTIEYAFLDNIDDYNFLKTNWKCLAESVVQTLCMYLNIEYKEPKKDLFWKEQIMLNALTEGLITGEHNPDEKADKWFVLKVVINALDILRKER